MQLLDGNLCSEQIRQEITQKVDALKADGQRAPHLAAVLVGNDGASENYVAFKVKDCAQVGSKARQPPNNNVTCDGSSSRPMPQISHLYFIFNYFVLSSPIPPPVLLLQ